MGLGVAAVEEVEVLGTGRAEERGGLCEVVEVDLIVIPVLEPWLVLVDDRVLDTTLERDRGVLKIGEQRPGSK